MLVQFLHSLCDRKKGLDLARAAGVLATTLTLDILLETFTN